MDSRAFLEGSTNIGNKGFEGARAKCLEHQLSKTRDYG